MLPQQMYLNIWTWFCSAFVSARTVMASMLKNTELKLQLVADVDMLLMAEKCVVQFIYVQKPIISTGKIIIKTKNHCISCTWAWTIFMDGKSQKPCLRMVLNGEKTRLGLLNNS